jgi:NAD(P)-dependent dehydrogenase (short-subunit alcohol dehydrogenase family)
MASHACRLNPTWVETSEMLRQFIDGDINATGSDTGRCVPNMQRSNPQNQLVQPVEVAELAAFLA